MIQSSKERTPLHFLLYLHLLKKVKRKLSASQRVRASFPRMQASRHLKK